jgi:hypothetical protein
MEMSYLTAIVVTFCQVGGHREACFQPIRLLTARVRAPSVNQGVDAQPAPPRHCFASSKGA